MKLNISLRFAIIASVVFSSQAIAQIPEPPSQKAPDVTVSLIGKSFGDSIVLRLAPASIDSWLRGNAFGYDIFRYKVVTGRNVVDRPVKELMTSQPLLPMKLEEIEHQYGADKYAAIVAQAIYGSSFNLNTHGENYNFLNMSSELSNRYSFALFACDMSFAAAKSHGLIFTDRNVEKDTKYVYSVKPHWRDTLSLADSALIFIAVADTYTVPPPIQVYARFQDKTVEISWDKKSMESLFTAYYIERSVDGGKSFSRINENPIINTVGEEKSKVRRMMFVDTIPEYNKEFFYRVRGLTPFGELSQPSEVVSGRGTEIKVGVNPIIIGSDRLEDGKINIKWEFPGEFQPEIKGFTVERSDKAEGVYKLISDTLKTDLRSFIDESPFTINYYQVCATSLSGYVYCSFPSLIQLPDSIPPAIPTGLRGEIDSMGIVRLQWNRNLESDLMSYKVYRSNHATADFVQINNTKLTGLSFMDTVPLNNLAGKVYYSVSAQDKNYNESEKCLAIKIIKPDTICPVPPRITDYRSGSNNIVLKWIPSSSVDVIKHVIYRRDFGDKEWQLIESCDSVKAMNSYRDTKLAINTTYEYLILAIDEAGLESQKNQSVSVRTYVNTNGTADISLHLTPGDDGKSINIRWYSKESEIGKILIYKSVDDQKFSLFQTLSSDEKQITDTATRPGHSYYYRAQVITGAGIRLKISEPYSIEL